MIEGGNSGRKEVPGRRWIDQIRFAFMEASGGNEKLEMTYDEWMNSRFRYLIEEREITDGEMNLFYNQMDENGDGRITWDELILFLTKRQKSIPGNTTKHLKIDYEQPTDPSPILDQYINPPKQTIFIQENNELTTLSDSQIVFWDIHQCNIIHKQEGDRFVGICFLSGLNVLAAVKSTPEIIFIDTKEHKIIENNITSSENFLQNKPTFVYNNKNDIIVIGYETGEIEILKIEKSKESKFSAKLIQKFNHHTDKVTKIMFIEEEKCYISSSLDTTLTMFNENGIISKISVNMGIVNFVYDPVSTNVFFSTPDHYFGYWRCRTSIFKIKDLEITKIVNLFIVRLSKRKSLLIATNTEHFFMTWKLPEFVSIGNWIYGDQHKDSLPTSGIILGNNVYLAGSFVSRWRINLFVTSDKIFQDPMAGFDFSGHHDPKFVLTCNSKAEMIFWNYRNGTIEHRQNITYGSEVLYMCVDEHHTRFGLSMADGRFITVNSLTGHHYSTCSLGFGGFPSILPTMAIIKGEPKLLVVENNQLMLYDDCQNGKYIYIRNFMKQKTEFTHLCVLKHSKVVSVHEDNTILLWEFSDGIPKMTFSVPVKITCISDLPDNENNFLVGCENGYIYVMDLEVEKPVSSFNVFHMTIPNKITCISTFEDEIAVSNDRGYIKTFVLNDGFEEISIFRAHSETVDRIVFVSENKVLTSSDGHVSMFSLCPPKYIGELGENNEWDSDGQSSWKNVDFIAQFDESEFEVGYCGYIKSEELCVREPITPRNTGDHAPRFVEEVPPLNINSVLNMMNEINDEENSDSMPTSPSLPKSISASARPRIVKPVVPKHPSGLPLFHSDGNQTIKIVETARQYKSIQLPDRRFKTGRSYVNIRFNV